jgi:predicted secreted protein
MTTGYHGHGTTFSIGGTSVGQIVSISGPNLSRDSIDISNMGSTNKWKEFLPGMLDAGECTIELIYDGTTVATLLAAQLTASASTMVVTYPDNGTWSAAGFITSLGHSVSFDDAVKQSVGVKFTGAGTASY